MESLYLDNSQVTDAGLPRLLHLQKLTGLHLSGTRVTDDGIQQLAALKLLRHLELNRTAVTDEGFDRLKNELPKVQWTNRERRAGR